MPYTFDAIQAFDPTDPQVIASNAEIIFHAVGDVSLTPLEITDVTGVPLPNPYTTNDLGAMPAFVHEALEQVAWSGGGQSGKLTSWEGLRGAAEASRDAAGASRDAALAAETAAVNASNLVGAPADTAIATAINGPGTQTQTALSNAIADSLGIGGNGSGVVFGIDPDGTPVLVIANSTIPPAAQVAGLVATAGVASASLTWVAPSSTGDAITDFSVQYRVVGTQAWFEWAHTPSTALAATVGGLTRYTEYEFRVAAVNLVGPGDYSTIATATPLGAAVSGTVVTDTFTRTSADLIGSAADTGQVWTATATGNLGRIEVNGTRALSKAVSTEPVLIDYGVRGNPTMTVTGRIPADGTTGDMDLYLKYIDLTHYVLLSIDTRATAVNITLSVRNGGTARVLTTFPVGTIAHGAATADYPLTFSVTGLTLSATVNGVSRSIDMTQAEADALATAHKAGIGGQNVAHQWDNLTIAATGTAA